MSDWLPREAIQGILINLPVKDVVTCTAVCKNWYSWIKDSNFISTHLKKQTNTACDGDLIFLLKHCNINRNHFTLLHNNNNTHVELDFPFGGKNERGKNLNFYVLGCCHGLVFLADPIYAYSLTLVLWNPSIRKALVLPRPAVRSATDCWIGLGFDSRKNDHKVLRICSRQYSSLLEAELFSLNANSWKRITASAPPKFHFEGSPSSTFVNGAIHWIGIRMSNKQSNFIVRFNVSNEVFDQIELPQSLVNSVFPSLELINYMDSSIAVVDTTIERVNIWKMTQYGRVDSWTRVFSGCISVRGGRVLWFTKEDEVLFDKNPETISDRVNLVSVNMSTRSMKRLIDRKEEDGATINLYFAHGFVESLVLLDKGKPATPRMLSL